MRGTVRSVSFLLAGIALMMLGNGLLGTVLSVRLAGTDLSTLTAGVVLSAYFAGLAVGSALGHRLIVAVGHIRSFAVLASIYSAATLVHAFALTPLLWGALRFVEGLCVAGIFMCTESWLNARASNANRGQIMSFYMIVLYLALGAGQFLLEAAEPEGFALFAIASAIASLSLVPVALSQVPAPHSLSPSRMSLISLYRLSPLGVFGSFASGVILGAFYALGPAYAHYEGLDLGQTAQFMATAIFGGLLLQWPIGAFSDRFDRRTVMLVLNGAIAVACLGVMLFASVSFVGLLVSAFVFGALSFVLYPLSVAHANDFAGNQDFVSVAGGLILAYSIGSIIGPIAAAALMDVVGPEGLFLFAALCALGALGYALWRMRIRAAPAEPHTRFVALPRTTPVSSGLDPRAPNEPEAELVVDPARRMP